MAVSDAERARLYRERNKEKVRAAKQTYYLQNKESEKARAAAWRASHPVEVKVLRKKWKEENKEAHADSVEAWRVAHPGAKSIHRQNRRARLKGCAGSLSKGLAKKLIVLQRGKCACGCGADISKEYHLDHIIPLAMGGANTDSNIQLLSPVCNKRKAAKHPIEFMQERGFLL